LIDGIDGLPSPRRWWAMAAIWLAMVMAVLDSAIANVALPTIARDLGASPPDAIWVVNAYQIAIVMLLLTVASLGEILGYRRIYAAGLMLFVAASVVCTFAGSLTALALARFAQGFGAAAIMGINGALVRFTWPRAQLGRGIGYNALVVAIASAAGPSVAAAVLAVGSWRWLFAINVPFGIASLAIGWAALPTPALAERRFDWRSAMLAAITFAALFAVAETLAHGGVSPATGVAAAIAVAAGWPLIRIARAERDPLIPLDLIGVPLLRLSYAASIAAFAAQMIGLVALPFYLQARWSFDHVQAGLAITALPLGIAVAAPVAGRLVERVSAGLLGGVGLGLLACGYAMIAALPPVAGTAALVVAIALCGVGFGLFQTPNNRTMMGATPARRSGAAAGMLATARLVGQTAGAVAVAGVFQAAGTTSAVPFAVAAVLGVLAALFSARRLRA
jgi:DHA2 family multidrug resistance protein-like MFS transporter